MKTHLSNLDIKNPGMVILSKKRVPESGMYAVTAKFGGENPVIEASHEIIKENLFSNLAKLFELTLVFVHEHKNSYYVGNTNNGEWVNIGEVNQ